MRWNVSLYWKCQLFGWSLFVLVTYVFNNIIYRDFVGFAIKGAFIFIFGLAFSHLLKRTINKLEILRKKFAIQIIYLLMLTILFALIGTYVWMMALIKTGVWSVAELRKSQPNVFFYQVFFYNLFPILLTFAGWVLIYFLVHYVRSVRKEEQLKMQYKLQMLELESRALRAQMNPHFIFNCLNSIKALIQNDDKYRSIEYLTTFSKLIRTLFQNSDKRQISLYDEIETCRLYMQLEGMRLNGKLKYDFCIDPNLDLKSVMIPALIIQPFIENAIWHGIIPKDGGTINVSINGNHEEIVCEVNDDGIGREMSKRNKPITSFMHESKGIYLSRARLNLEKMLNDTDASIETIDKFANNKPAGTKVVLRFTLQ